MDTTPEYLQDDCIFLSPSGAELAVAVDYAGDIRWCLNIKCVFDMKRLKNGHILMGTDRLVQMPYYMSGMYETSAARFTTSTVCLAALTMMRLRCRTAAFSA